ncbi:Wzz/FepE/Etk N-terminal domain-containing protein [Stutzerimonas stutzeri]|uniref:Wzz/FepE/Etk N-terminal domain-containing protein n=1 Tax=Stutzerimonas stutzeri TaxID=316 RepID=UPI0009BEF768
MPRFLIRPRGGECTAVWNGLDTDEVDLVALFRQLWKGRVTILLMATLATSLAVAYALWVPPGLSCAGSHSTWRAGQSRNLSQDRCRLSQLSRLR